jgi:hypothetical protein
MYERKRNNELMTHYNIKAGRSSGEANNIV